MMRDWIFRTERFFLSVTTFWSGGWVQILSWVIRVKIIAHKFLAVFFVQGADLIRIPICSVRSCGEKIS